MQWLVCEQTNKHAQIVDNRVAECERPASAIATADRLARRIGHHGATPLILRSEQKRGPVNYKNSEISTGARQDSEVGTASTIGKMSVKSFTN